MAPSHSDVDYNEKLNYKLLTTSLLGFTQLLGACIIDIRTLKIIKTQMIYNYLTLGITMYHIYITPDLFLNLKYKMGEFNFKSTVYHNVLRVMFPIILDITAILSKITVYRMKIYFNKLYNYLYLSDMYINFNKSLANADSRGSGKQNNDSQEKWWFAKNTNILTHPEKTNCKEFKKSTKENIRDQRPVASHVNKDDSNKTIRLFELHHKKISNYAILILIFLILPANIMRLCELFRSSTISKGDICYITFMYWENLFVACIELQFVMICYSIYLRFFEINIMLENIYNNYQRPMLNSLAGDGFKFYITDDIFIENLDTTEYKIIEDTPLENINFEYVRISHLFLCEAYVVLNNIFKFQIIFSLGCCFATSLLDLYYEFFGNEIVPTTKINAKVYFWIIQYFVRFASIVIVAHKTTIESMKTKNLVTTLNNQHLSIETQEELKLFLRQVESREMGFSAGGLFTLSTPLITSALAAGVTYLVVLIQFHNDLLNQKK